MKFALTCLAVLVLLTTHVRASADPAPPADAATLYSDAERLYLKSNAQGALQSLSKFFALPSASVPVRDKIRAHNLRGLIYFQTRSLQPAMQEFEAAVQLANRGLTESDSLLHLTRYNLGNAYFQVNKSEDAYDLLKTVTPDSLDPDTRARFHHLFGNVLSARDEKLEALVQYLGAANLAKDVAARDTFLQKAQNASKSIYLKSPKQDLDRLAALSFPAGSPADFAAQIFMARGYMYMGDSAHAESILEKVLKEIEPNHPLRARAEEMLADLGKLSKVNPKAIGVLLPLSGKFGKFGRLCLNAILMAHGVYEEMPERVDANGLHLIIRDSGETPESATEKFEELVKDQGVVAVIGPLLSKQFPALARKAQEFGVPLVSLSQRIEVGAMGSYIFPVALSPNQQIETIVSHAIGKEGFKRFAILAPSDSFGEEYVNLFWDAVEKAGGKIVGVERYEPKSTDFREEVRRLLGQEYLGARKIEMEDLERRKERYAATLKVKGKLRQRFLKEYDAKPVVDFDALFIPDDPATVGQIAPAFAVEDVANLPLLGINTWNTPDIVQRAGRYLQRALFVDGYFANTQNEKSIQFIQDYTRFFKSVPGTIEVQAFDAATILIEALKGHTLASRAALRDQLLSKDKFSGISGDYRFTENGVQRGAHLLTVKGNSITEITDSPSKR
ncbi:MAG: penicillin-binding protein activator [Bdellovibrionota bacterium]